MRSKHALYTLFIFGILIAGCKGSDVSQQPVNLQLDDNRPVGLFGEGGGDKTLATYHDAMKEKMLGNNEKAADMFRDVLKKEPKNAAAHYQLATLLEETDELEEAALHAREAVKLEENNRYYLELHASLQRTFGKNKEAIEIYQKLVKAYPGNYDYYLELAFLYEGTGKAKEAIEVYNQLEQKVGVDESISMQKQRLYLQQGDFSNAVKELEKLIEMYPTEGKYYGMLGEMYEANDQPKKALEAYQKLQQVDPNNGLALFSLARYYRNQGDQEQYLKYMRQAYDQPSLDIDSKIRHLMSYIDIVVISEDKQVEAFDLAERLINAHPEDPKGYAVYGDLLNRSRKKKEALAQYRKALNRSGSNFSIWQQTLFMTAETQQYDSLEVLSQEAIELFPSQAVPYFLNGLANSQLKEYDKAILRLDRALLISSGDKMLAADIWSTMGDTYHAMKKHAESDSCYEESLKLRPDNAYVLNNYAYYLSNRKKNLERAAEMAQQANELEPGNSAFQDTYGWISYQQGDYSNAEKWIKKALDNGGNKRPVILEHYGDVLFQLNRVDDAVDYWQQALEHGGDKEQLEKKIRERKLYE